MISQSPGPVTPEAPPEARLCISCHRRHMNTLQLQMEVTRFLHRCESAGTSQITPLPLPTLFGNNHMKMDVACKVCTMCQTSGRLFSFRAPVTLVIVQLSLFQSFFCWLPPRWNESPGRLETESVLITLVSLVPALSRVSTNIC